MLGVDRLPAAFVRSDWATLAYEGKFNTIFGEVGSGKTWVALMMAIERLHAGRHVIWWDTEDQPSTLARRLQVLRATDLIGHPALKWTNGDFQDNPAIMAEALEGLGSGNGPGLVVIDSATSFGCPSDGGNIAAWLKAFIDPWENAGHSVELLDHVPKQRKDRPRGDAVSAQVPGRGIQVWHPPGRFDFGERRRKKRIGLGVGAGQHSTGWGTSRRGGETVLVASSFAQARIVFEAVKTSLELMGEDWRR